MVISRQLNLFTRMKLLKLGVFLSMLLMTPVLEAQNTSVSLWEENIEQLSMDEEEKNWEDELEELSNRLQETQKQ